MDARVKVWQQLRRNSGNRIEKLTVERSPVLAPGHIELDQLTVITGTHGVGKSYLLRVFDAALPLGYSYPTGPPFTWINHRDESEGRLDGQYRLDYSRGGEPSCWAIDFSDSQARGQRLLEHLGEDEPWSIYVEPTAAFSEYEMYFQESVRPSNLGEPTTLRRAEVDNLRDILGRRYDRESVILRDTVIGGEDTVPYIEATVEGRAVSNETMSRGELWVHYCLWWLRKADSACLVIIDEPEAFLSPSGHTAFLDEIARLTLARGAQTILATHSAEMIARTPPQLVRVLTPSPVGTRVIKPGNSAAALRLLGHRPGLAGIVLVEDDTARSIVANALAVPDHDVGDAVVEACGGW